MQQIKSALHNTLYKTKAHIRRSGEIPKAETVFQWFYDISDLTIFPDQQPVDASNINKNSFESMFYFNGLIVHLTLNYTNMEYRGHPYFDANANFIILNDLDKEDYSDEILMEWFKKKYGIVF